MWNDVIDFQVGIHTIKSMKSVVSEKGQVTIPKALRTSLGLSPGTELDFSEVDGRLVAERVIVHHPIETLVGLLPRLHVDARIADLRGPAWDDAVDGADVHRGR